MLKDEKGEVLVLIHSSGLSPELQSELEDLLSKNISPDEVFKLLDTYLLAQLNLRASEFTKFSQNLKGKYEQADKDYRTYRRNLELEVEEKLSQPENKLIDAQERIWNSYHEAISAERHRYEENIKRIGLEAVLAIQPRI